MTKILLLLPILLFFSCNKPNETDNNNQSRFDISMKWTGAFNDYGYTIDLNACEGQIFDGRSSAIVDEIKGSITSTPIRFFTFSETTCVEMILVIEELSFGNRIPEESILEIIVLRDEELYFTKTYNLDSDTELKELSFLFSSTANAIESVN